MGQPPVNALFDTNLVVDALNGVVAAAAEYSRYARVLISRITWMEVLVDAVLVTRNTRDFHVDWEGIRAPYQLP
jgi:hypothetical protein